ncbi:hypothetical protein HG1285_06070 [Hydrogenivirga sp. 128-5-R1-1]|nr:hypothetical protein HG1285_06070 [Hydrogenivirga sp. 128-5-R1-1]
MKAYELDSTTLWLLLRGKIRLPFWERVFSFLRASSYRR